MRDRIAIALTCPVEKDSNHVRNRRSIRDYVEMENVVIQMELQSRGSRHKKVHATTDRHLPSLSDAPTLTDAPNDAPETAERLIVARSPGRTHGPIALIPHPESGAQSIESVAARLLEPLRAKTTESEMLVDALRDLHV